jgi:hypothetical protein
MDSRVGCMHPTAPTMHRPWPGTRAGRVLPAPGAATLAQQACASRPLQRMHALLGVIHPNSTRKQAWATPTTPTGCSQLGSTVLITPLKKAQGSRCQPESVDPPVLLAALQCCSGQTECSLQARHSRGVQLLCIQGCSCCAVGLRGRARTHQCPVPGTSCRASEGSRS